MPPLTDKDLEDFDKLEQSEKNAPPLTNRDIGIFEMQEQQKEAAQNTPAKNALIAATMKLRRLEPLARQMPDEYNAALKEYTQAYDAWLFEGGSRRKRSILIHG